MTWVARPVDASCDAMFELHAGAVGADRCTGDVVVVELALARVVELVGGGVLVLREGCPAGLD